METGLVRKEGRLGVNPGVNIAFLIVKLALNENGGMKREEMPGEC